MKTLAVYLLRFLLSVAACAAVLVGLLAAKHVTVWEGNYLINLLSLLDVFHHMFYAAAGAVVIVALLSLWPRFLAGPRWRAPGLLMHLVAAALLAALPIAAVQAARPGAVLPSWLYSGSLYLALNFWLLFSGSALMARQPQWAARIRRVVVLADVVAPLLVWAAYRAREPKRVRGLQLLPLLLVVSTAYLPWIVRPYHDPGFNSVPHAAMRPVYRLRAYQVAVDPADGRLIICDNDNHLQKIDPASGTMTAEAAMLPVHDTIQGFGVDQQAREVAYADPCTGHSWVFDETDLRLKQTAVIADDQDHRPAHCGFAAREGNRAVWSAAAGVLVTFTYGPSLSVLSATSHRTLFDKQEFVTQLQTRWDEFAAEAINNRSCNRAPVRRRREGSAADAVIDPERRQLHWATTTPALWRLDLDRRRVERMLCLPTLPERIALDARRHRLFITLPILGQVLVVDETSYRRAAAIHSFPGVRTVTVDAAQDRLILGGFSPVLEIRSLTDFSLQDRITAPSWMRWVAIDAARNKAYVAANVSDASVWELDLTRLRQDRWGAFWRTIDPFYPLMRLLASWIRPLILRLHPDASAFAALSQPPPVSVAGVRSSTRSDA